jgi:hypothetical protein
MSRDWKYYSDVHVGLLLCQQRIKTEPKNGNILTQ